MKLNIGNKILLLLHWLCSMMICVAFALCVIVPGLQGNLTAKAESSLGSVGARIAGAVVLALYIVLSVVVLMRLLRGRRREEQGFITVGSDEKGRVRIAVSAVEQMVRQSVRTIDGLSDMKVDIEGADDAIAIGITAAIANGAHVPTLTANMRRAITQFVEVSCGVAVQSVTVTIEAVSGKGDVARRRLLGRDKSQADVPVSTYEPEIPVRETVEAGTMESEPVEVEPVADEPAFEIRTPTVENDEDTWQGMPETEDEASEAQAPAYDPDKPYVSEFAKDYAAMKARESAAETDSDDADGE